MSDADPCRSFTEACRPLARTATRAAHASPAHFPPSALELARQELRWLERTLAIIREADDLYQTRLPAPSEWFDPRQLNLFNLAAPAEGGKP